MDHDTAAGEVDGENMIIAPSAPVQLEGIENVYVPKSISFVSNSGATGETATWESSDDDDDDSVSANQIDYMYQTNNTAATHTKRLSVEINQ